MDGEVSEPDFNSTGDEALRLASSIIETLHNITNHWDSVERNITAPEDLD